MKKAMIKKNLLNTVSLGLSLVVGLMCLNGPSRALASIPSEGSSAGKITDDTLIYDNLREISVKKEHEVNFDTDLSRLSAMERHYKERKLPNRVSYQSAKKASVRPVAHKKGR